MHVHIGIDRDQSAIARGADRVQAARRPARLWRAAILQSETVARGWADDAGGRSCSETPGCLDAVDQASVDSHSPLLRRSARYAEWARDGPTASRLSEPRIRAATSDIIDGARPDESACARTGPRPCRRPPREAALQHAARWPRSCPPPYGACAAGRIPRRAKPGRSRASRNLRERHQDLPTLDHAGRLPRPTSRCIGPAADPQVVGSPVHTSIER